MPVGSILLRWSYNSHTRRAVLMSGHSPGAPAARGWGNSKDPWAGMDDLSLGSNQTQVYPQVVTLGQKEYRM